MLAHLKIRERNYTNKYKSSKNRSHLPFLSENSQHSFFLMIFLKAGIKMGILLTERWMTKKIILEPLTLMKISILVIIMNGFVSYAQFEEKMLILMIIHPKISHLARQS